MSLANRRVAVVLASLDLGGAERQAVLLASRLQRDHGADIAVYGMGDGTVVGELCQRLGLPCTALPRVESRWSWRARGRMRSAMTRIAAFRPEVLLPFTAPANIACTVMRKHSGALLALWNQRDEGLGFAPEPMVRAGLAVAHAIIANGPGSAAYLVERGVPAGRILRLPNAVDLDPPQVPRSAWRARLQATDSDLVVSMIANLTLAKDHRTLIDAFAQVRQRGCPAILALAGRDDGRGPDLIAQVAQLGISATVRFLGAIADVAGLLAASDLAVHSSRSEGCPNAVLEAMAAGCAVIGSDIPGIAAVLDPTCLVPVGDSAALAAAILARADDALARTQLAARQQALSLTSYAPSVVTSLLADCLTRLLAQSPQP